VGNVVKFYSADAAKDPDNVLEQAIGEYEKVIVLGYNEDGDMDARSSTNLDHGEILWILQKFSHKLLAGDYSEEEE